MAERIWNKYRMGAVLSMEDISIFSRLDELETASFVGDLTIELSPQGLNSRDAEIARKLNKILKKYLMSQRTGRGQSSDALSQCALMEVRISQFEALGGGAQWDMEITAQHMTARKAWFSDRYREMLGYVYDSDFPSLFSALIERVHPEDKDRVLHAFNLFFGDDSGRTDYEMEYRMKNKANEYIWVREICNWYSNDNAKYVLGMTKNMSNKVRIDELSKFISEFHIEINTLIENVTKIFDSSVMLKKSSTRNMETSTKAMGNVKAIKSTLTKIRSVARQTNLLAINATIEAAHAGEYGKGFIIIAEEVRNLAEKSANSVREMEAALDNIQYSTKTIEADISKTVQLVDEKEQLAIEMKEVLEKMIKTYEEFAEVMKKSIQGSTQRDKLSLK